MERSLHKRPASGQALLEFALIIPLLFLLIVNVVNFGAMLYAFTTVANAARTGAQYYAIGGAMVQSPAQPDATLVQPLLAQDLASLPNRNNAQIQVCRRSAAGTTCVCATGAGAACAVTGTWLPPLDNESTPYMTLSVDVGYPYTPLIPLWDFPALNIHATLPPMTIHRQSVMRVLN
jgi:Flp pilus assembly protein TadG